ncbi:MAG: LLM class flavin-dependent oxidoreductase [Dehalococcoidia bacterium]|nr:LLM class flavin-dependent oxidoreductase [Dehalococcoidia bacterium]
MRIAVNLTTDSHGDWQSAVAFAKEAERLGAESIWTGESWGYDAITPLAYLAAGTDRIGLGTGIIQLGTRSPANLAMTAMSMQSLSGNRFRLGLGTSGPQVVEGWHGVSFAKPIQRTREIIEIVRLVTSGERVSYDGDIYQLPMPGGEGRALRSSSPPVHVPIYVAALGPRNLELTGELADGWIGGSFIPETAEMFLKHIRAGAERAGRKLEDLDLQIPLSVEITDDVKEAGKRHARGYGFTFGAMGSLRNNFYKNAFARQGFANEVNEVQRLWMARERDKARDHVPVELAMKANLIGTPAMIKERIAVYRDSGITTLRIGIPGEGVFEKLETLAQVIDLVRETERA